MNTSYKTILSFVAVTLLIMIGLIGLGDALIPLALSFFGAYLLFPFIKALESKGAKRELALLIAFLLIIGPALGLMIVLGPILIEEGRVFLTDLPYNLKMALSKVNQELAVLGVSLPETKDFFLESLDNNFKEISKALLKGIGPSFTGISGLILFFLNILLGPLFFFYIILDFEKIVDQLYSFLPLRFKENFHAYLNLTNEVLKGHIRGQFLVAISLGILYAAGLWAIGLKYGVIIGLLSGLLNIIPYAGISIGLASSLITAVATSSGPSTILGVLLVYGVVQMLEGLIITPKLVGEKVGLSSFTSILALIIGGNLLGIPGMLLGIPLAAIVKSVLLDLKKQYKGAKDH